MDRDPDTSRDPYVRDPEPARDDDVRDPDTTREPYVRDPDRDPYARDADPRERYGWYRTRGGVSFGSILTGVVVAFGAMAVLLAVAGGIAVATGASVDPEAVDPVQTGVVVGIVLIVAQFLAYLWGGYTAGRMARGAGFLNGLLVPIAALLVAVGVGALVTALGAEAARFGVIIGETRLPIQEDLALQVGLPIGILSLVAMFGGAILGGILGARWHDKLETEPGIARGPVTEPA
jgi:hypothetical protein